MKKKTLTTIAIALVTTACLSACGAFGGGSSGSAPAAKSTTASYEAAYDTAYDEDVYEEYEAATAAEELYMAADTVAMAPRMAVPESAASGKGSGESGNDSGPGNQAVQTSDSGTDGLDAPQEPAEQGDEPETPAGTDDASGSDSVKKRKLITTVSIEAETETLDDILQRIESEVLAFGGYIESSYIAQDRTYVGNNTYTNRRRATMTLRVPESKFETILSTVSGETNVLEESRTTEDITLTYVDIESRKKSLETQRESLLRLLEQAETVEDIITIEDRLSYVNYEIERMGGQLRTYDNLVDYATVHLTLREVVEYTPVQEEPETVFSRISKGFSYNLKRVGGGLVDFFVWLVSSLPQIAVIAVVVVAVVKGLGWLKGRRASRRAARGGYAPGGTPAAAKERRGLFGRKKTPAGQETADAHETAPAAEAGKESRTDEH